MYGDWKGQANQRIEQLRKGDFRISVVDANKPARPLCGVRVEIDQVRHHFAFGSAINFNVSNPRYAEFFKENFEWAVMENESKWYSNEPEEGKVTYAVADRIYDFCRRNDIIMRGHCIFWAKENFVQDWIKALDGVKLRSAVKARLKSVTSHFKGKFVHWDVNNEMCDGSFYADKLGKEIRPWMFKAAHAIDPDCKLFVNDYDIISNSKNLDIYKQQIAELLKAGGPIHGIGVQCHMQTGFDPVAVKKRFDSLMEMNLPVWVTEFDVSVADENIRADELEKLYRTAFSHPAVKGILMWGFWEKSHWRENAYIVNADWTLNAAGLRYKSLMREWTTHDTGKTKSSGHVDFRGFYGRYRVRLTADGFEPRVTTIEITPDGPDKFTVKLRGLSAKAVLPKS